MTSRERIPAAVNHEPVDRRPIDFGGTRQSGISVFASVHNLQADVPPENIVALFETAFTHPLAA